MMRFYFKIKLLGRQLEFPSASSSPSPDSQSDTTNPGAAMDDEESPPLPPSASEKETKQPTDYLALGAGVLRVWQLSSSCFVYASTVSLYVYMRHVSLISDSSTLRHVRELVSPSFSVSPALLPTRFSLHAMSRLCPNNSAGKFTVYFPSVGQCLTWRALLRACCVLAACSLLMRDARCRASFLARTAPS